MSEEQQPDWIAQLDQALRTVADAARLTYAYYCGLVEAGFSEDQALALTLGWQAATINAGQNRG